MEPSNYRPVSLMSVPGRLEEMLIYDRLIKHIEEQCLLEENQHGFFKEKSAPAVF